MPNMVHEQCERERSRNQKRCNRRFQTPEGLITLTNLALLNLQALNHEINNQQSFSIVQEHLQGMTHWYKTHQTKKGYPEHLRISEKSKILFSSRIISTLKYTKQSFCGKKNISHFTFQSETVKTLYMSMHTSIHAAT